MWKGKKVLVSGSEGMIGKELVEQLNNLGAEVTGIDLKQGKDCDLRKYWTCYNLCKDADIVFHLAGIKGSPRMTNERPLDFIGPMLQFDTNMILAALKCGVSKFLYTSSIAVENIETDKFPAWAKMTGEMLIEAIRIQYKVKTYGTETTDYCIVRPSNVYGRFDNFDNPNAMVITSLIKKALTYKQIDVWGNGSEVRDFINAQDVARGMIDVMTEMPTEPINLCSGESHTIKDVAEIISSITKKKVFYDENRKTGAKSRVMKPNWPLEIKVSLKQGIEEAIEWAKN